MNIPFSPPDISEREIESVVETLRSGWITTGPKTKKFEKQIAAYVGTERVVCLNSSTAAMEMTLRLLGIGPGDEVIVPAYNYTASCSVICHVGATPVMVDIQQDHPEMDYIKVAEAITERTKVIIPVDLAGIVCDYETLYRVLEGKKSLFHANTKNELQKHFDRIIVMSDSAHGCGAIRAGSRAGCVAEFTCFSFHAVKYLTTAEGGAVTWKNVSGVNNEWIYKQYMNLSLHGQTKDALNKTKIGSWEYDIVSPAYKCNMTDIQASIGLEQLKRYEEMLKRRHEVIDQYDEAFKDMSVYRLCHEDERQRSSGHLYFIRPKGIGELERNEIIAKLAERGIATNVHYKPLPLLTAYRNLGFEMNDYPNSYAFKLTEEQVEYIIDNTGKVLQDYVD